MTAFVLLTDNDDATMLVACEDMKDAESVAASAVFSDGGVSAWLVPSVGIVHSQVPKLKELLEEGYDLGQIEGQIGGAWVGVETTYDGEDD